MNGEGGRATRLDTGLVLWAWAQEEDAKRGEKDGCGKGGGQDTALRVRPAEFWPQKLGSCDDTPKL